MTPNADSGGHQNADSPCLCGVIKIGGKPTGHRNWNPDCPVHPWTDAMQAQADRAVEMQLRARAARKQRDSYGPPPNGRSET